ncbi:MAG: helix-turn-helix domain-containing protein [Micrococcaceae bacterium]
MEALTHLINESSLSKSAIARRAGLSASTVSRIAAGALDPTMGTATNLLHALGHQFPAEMPTLCDSEAPRTARRLMMGERVEGHWAETLERWSDTVIDLVREAGRAAPLARRSETVTIRTSWTPLRIYGAVQATGAPWVASGWPAGVAYGGGDATEGPLVLYVEGGASALGLALPHDPGGTREIYVLPFDGVSERDAQSSDGIVWADPYQVCLDLCADHRTEHLGVELVGSLEDDHD